MPESAILRPCFLQRAGAPLVLGHRGASATHPENTLLAFRQAMADGADGVELDVMRCGSGELVVVHDDDLGRVIGQKPGTGPWIRSSTLAELRSHDVGSGERVPLLSEVMEELGPHALINIELKSPDVKTFGEHARLVRNDGLAEAAAELLARMPRPPGTTLLSSFDPMQLWRFDRAVKLQRPQVESELPLGFLFHRKQPLPLRAGWPSRVLPVAAVHPDAALVDALSMRRWRKKGYFVHVWTVDDAREIAALCALGVDAIITNAPAATRALVDRLAPSKPPSGDVLASS